MEQGDKIRAEREAKMTSEEKRQEVIKEMKTCKVFMVMFAVLFLASVYIRSGPLMIFTTICFLVSLDIYEEDKKHDR